ncbi:unnamed protein product [Closterium sp. NIES-64]|nr:unnamed protein product [Closterium sp. NIES-64]
MARLSVVFLGLLVLAVIICAEAGKASTLSKKGKTGGKVKGGVKAGGEIKGGVKAGGEVKVGMGVKTGGSVKGGVKKGGSKKGGSKKGESKKPVATAPKQVGASSGKGADLTSYTDSFSTFDAGEVRIKGSSWNAKQCPNDLAKKGWGGCTAVNCSKGGWPAKFKTSIITTKKGNHWATILPNGGFSKKKATPESCCNQCAASHDCTYWQFIPGNGREMGTCDLMAGEQNFECGDLAAIYEGKDKPVYLQVRAGGRCNDNPEVIDDPHFTGAHGTHFDFNGRPDKAFCLLTDKNVHVNMLLRGYYDDRTEGAALVVDGKAVHTWIKELGIVWFANGADHRLRLVARNGKEQERGAGYMKAIEVDGTVIQRLALGEEFNGDGGLTVALRAYEKQGPYDVDYYTVSIAGIISFDIRLRVAHPKLQTPSDAEVHINVAVTSFDYTENVHGVLGQTYREDHVDRAIDFQQLVSSLHRPISADGELGAGFLDGTPRAYEAASVLGVDCAMAAYHRAMPESSASN